MILLPEQTLSDWLRIATWRLADSAKVRIRIEIEAHYTQAVEAHRGNGLSETDARVAALTELGDPEAAAKRFRKRHLTEWEAYRLRRLEKGPRSIWYPLGCYLLFWFCTTDLFWFRHNWLASCNSLPLFLASAFLVCVTLPTACFLVARYPRATPNRPALVMVCALTETAAYAFFYAGCIVHPAFRTASLIVNCSITILFSAFMMFRLLSLLRIWNKVSKAGATNLGQAL